MSKFLVTVERRDTFWKEVEIEAETEEDVRVEVEEILRTDGWDGLFNGDDGEYESCEADLRSITEVL